MRCDAIGSIARPNLDRSDKWIHRATIKMVRSSELTTHIMSQLSCTLWWNIHARACANTATHAANIHVIMQSMVENFAFQSIRQRPSDRSLFFVFFPHLISIQLFILIAIEEISFNGNIGAETLCIMYVSTVTTATATATTAAATSESVANGV